MRRYEVINKLIQRYGYKQYLELGTQNNVCLQNVVCEFKVGVDPDPTEHKDENSNEFYEMTSDEFFAQNTDIFEIVFVDGLHEKNQVVKDISNAMCCISPDGAIVVHDCNPQEEKNQEYPMPHVGDWNGTVWRAWLKFRTVKGLKMFVVDTDQGCGVIMDGTQTPLDDDNISFDEFVKNRKAYLNLISIDEFNESLSV